MSQQGINNSTLNSSQSDCFGWSVRGLALNLGQLHPERMRFNLLSTGDGVSFITGYKLHSKMQSTKEVTTALRALFVFRGSELSLFTANAN